MDEVTGLADVDNEVRLGKRVQQIVDEQNLVQQRELIQKMSAQLDISIMDFAAALLFLNQPHSNSRSKTLNSLVIEPIRTNYRFVRYRLDVGSQHLVSKEQIQAVLIEESGVDKKRIGRIDIHPAYTLVELPDGMPADIFQLLSEAVICERKLAIKRVKPNRRSSKK